MTANRGGGLPRQPAGAVSPGLFSWDANDLNLTARTGQAATFSRSSEAYGIGTDGGVYRVGNHAPRWEYSPASGLFGLLYEPVACTNKLLRSEELSDAAWASSQTPVVTDNALRCGNLALSLVADDSGSLQEYRYQSMTSTFGSTGSKGVSFFFAKGTSSAASGSQVVLRDTTASADRLALTITWSGSTPSVVANTGTLLKVVGPLANGVYRCLAVTTSVTNGNTHELRVIPAITAAQTGNIYFGGGQVEDAASPSSYIKSAGTSGSRSAESLYWTLNALPRALTLYLKWTECGVVLRTGTSLVSLGVSGTNPSLRIYPASSTTLAVNHHNGSSSQASGTVTAPLSHVASEARLTLNADGSTGLGLSLSGGTETNASAGAALALGATWGPQRLTPGEGGPILLSRVLVLAGAKTLSNMQRGF